MRAIPVILVAVSVTAISGMAARACDNDRYPCEPKIAKPASIKPTLTADTRVAPKPISSAAQAGRKIAPRSMQRTAEEKAPPDVVQAPPKIRNVAVWQPIDIPSQAVEPLDGNDDPAETRDPISIVSADELNEIDLAALSVPEPVKVVPIRVMWPEPPAPVRPVTQVVTAPPAPASADTSLLERVMVTFGGAFGAASALRMFVG